MAASMRGVNALTPTPGRRHSSETLLPFLQGNLPLVLGAMLLAVLVTLRASTEDEAFQVDLRGSFFYLVAFLVLRTFELLVHRHLSQPMAKALTVIWMLCFAFGVIRATVSLVLRFLRLSNKPTPKILRDVVDISLYAFAAVPILKSELDIDLTGLLATSAILSVVIGLALQDTLGNLFAGLSIQVERPFEVGDIVTIDDYTGTVVQVAWRATRLETGRGEVITLPNNILSKQPVKNYSRSSRAIGIDSVLGISYEAAPNRVKEIILAVMKDIPEVLIQPPPRCWTAAYDDSSIRYAVRFFVAEFGKADAVKDEFYSRLWYCLRREGIDIPYPQRTVHLVRNSKASPELVPSAVSELLKNTDLFSSLSEEDRNQLSRQLSQRSFGKGERIIEHGSQGEAFYIIASGEVSVRTPDGQVEVSRLKEGQYFGEMSLLTGEPRAATVTAITDCLLLQVERAAFARLLSRYPQWAHELSALLAQRRNELKAAAEMTGEAGNHNPEAGRILGRLRHMFGLTHE